MATINAIGSNKPIEIAFGGTGAASFTAFALVAGGTTSTNPLQNVSGTGTTGQLLVAVTGGLPVWTNAGTASSISITGNSGGALVGNAFTLTGGTTGLTFSGAGTTETLTGTLVVANGGTGAATLLAHGLLVGNGTTAITQLAVAATGSTLMGVTGADPAFTGSPSFSGSVTAATSITATAGNVVVTSGNLTLADTTSSSIGSILIGGNRFLHKFGALYNTFLGTNAGNYTMSGALYNTGLGYLNLNALTSGTENTSAGLSSAAKLTSGARNSAYGTNSLGQLLTGTDTVAIGNSAGFALTGSESSNILIGASVQGTIGESNVLRIGNGTGTGAAQINKAVIAGINGKGTGTASSVVIIGTGDIVGTTSTGTVSLNTATNQLDISADASATTVNVGTGGAAKIVTVGSTNGASSLALKTGTADFTLASATGTIMSALDTGEITYPLQTAFLAFLPSTDLNKTGAGGAFNIGSATALTEVFDQNSDFNTNGTFTAPITARYFVQGCVTVTGCTIASLMNTQLVTSNRTYIFQLNRAAGAANFTAGGSLLADFDAADTMTCNVLITGEAGDTDDIFGSATIGYTFMSGHLAC